MKDDDGAAAALRPRDLRRLAARPLVRLDGTHPEAQKHLETVFRTMRQDWGVHLLQARRELLGRDARRASSTTPTATRVEAYRRGMEAVLRGAGDGFILGCNHPIWALARPDPRLAQLERHQARLGALRARPPARTSAATGRTAASGGTTRMRRADGRARRGGVPLPRDVDLRQRRDDPVRRRPHEDRAPPPGDAAQAAAADRRAARFSDESLRVGLVDLPGRRAVCLLNWDDAPRTLSFALSGPHHVRELWTDEDHGRHAGGAVSVDLPGRSGRVFLCTPA